MAKSFGLMQQQSQSAGGALLCSVPVQSLQSAWTGLDSPLICNRIKMSSTRASELRRKGNI